jgi:hypothetical protein
MEPTLPLLLQQRWQQLLPVRLAKPTQRLQQLDLLPLPQLHREQALLLLLLLALVLVLY